MIKENMLYALATFRQMITKTLSVYTRFWKIIVPILGIILVLLIVIHDVPKAPTEKDKQFIFTIYPKPPINAQLFSFEQQVALIQSFQKSIHQQFIIGDPIAYNQSREPEDLVNHKEGRCYDFSRTIEKFLMLNQFEVRHVAVYQVNPKVGKLLSFLKVQGASHSLTEVKTKKGWMIVDSNFEWIGIDSLGQPKSFREICAKRQTWKYRVVKGYEPFFNECPIYIYGLYSRHGCFYPPYTFIPDYHFKDLLYNLSR